MLRYIFTLPLLAQVLPFAQAHSWVERINLEVDGLIDLDTTGYARGNVLRTSPYFSDEKMTYQLPPNGRDPFQVLPTDFICSPSQRNPTLSNDSPMLLVPNGVDNIVALQYNENGHITKPWNNSPGKLGTGEVSLYGTNHSLPSDTIQSIHNIWNEDGTGGDQRGKLLYRGPFDDGMCYQYTDETSGLSKIEAERAAQYPGPGSSDPAQALNKWCLVKAIVPPLSVGSMYTIYWVWDWSTKDAEQIYTTCVDVVGGR